MYLTPLKQPDTSIFKDLQFTASLRPNNAFVENTVGITLSGSICRYNFLILFPDSTKEIVPSLIMKQSLASIYYFQEETPHSHIIFSKRYIKNTIE